ncbi:hypothetical protein KP509_08G048600 [Ceratopteris richardii]|uniref:K-box domain-containing protein n=1 Tax=Ceratopteris richardii TaxID=49495 RepID=A0A8T2UG85_CERRI|nr:hypothetical protein KP509_08G048600 [Ceratopteris richardii]
MNTQILEHLYEAWEQERTAGKHMHLTGENLGRLDVKDLQNLESQLQTGVTRVRARKMQLMMENMHELRRREAVLLRENELLKLKLAEASSLQAGSVTTENTNQDIHDISSGKPDFAKTLAFPHVVNPSVAQTTLQLGCPRM